MNELSERIAALPPEKRAALVRKLRGGKTPSPHGAIGPRPQRSNIPLSFSQERLWFLEQLEPSNPVYNLPMAMELEGPLDESVLRRCLGEIVQRHEALRTR